MKQHFFMTDKNTDGSLLLELHIVHTKEKEQKGEGIISFHPAKGGEVLPASKKKTTRRK